MSRSASASSWSVRRSRRPQTRLATRYQETSTASRCSENDCWDCGGADCGAGAKGIAFRGTVRLHWAADGYLNSARSILIPRFALPPVIRDKNRMR
jgi:hypothetical protein